MTVLKFLFFRYDIYDTDKAGHQQRVQLRCRADTYVIDPFPLSHVQYPAHGVIILKTNLNIIAHLSNET